jgi:hypothetical protein
MLFFLQFIEKLALLRINMAGIQIDHTTNFQYQSLRYWFISLGPDKMKPVYADHPTNLQKH